MLTILLEPHPDSSAASVAGIRVDCERPAPTALLLNYILDGETGDITLPEARRTPQRQDGLWQTTCFELFLRVDGCPGYWEFNFSPSGDWAAYRFSDYRAGMTSPELIRPPRVECERTHQRLIVRAEIDLAPHLPYLPATGELQGIVSAVLEGPAGTTSYWASKHPAGKPDFHHPDNFVPLFPL
jgi:hypothetical protein